MKSTFFTSFFIVCVTFLGYEMNAQSVGINNDNSIPHASSILDVKSTERGMLVPRMTTLQRIAIPTPATGLLVYDQTTNSFWFYNSSAWEEMSAGFATELRDADNDTKVQVEESPDEDMIRFDVGGVEGMVLRKNASGDPCLEFVNPNGNSFIGKNAGSGNTTGNSNSGYGWEALKANTTGNNN